MEWNIQVSGCSVRTLWYLLGNIRIKTNLFFFYVKFVCLSKIVKKNHDHFFIIALVTYLCIKRLHLFFLNQIIPKYCGDSANSISIQVNSINWITSGFCDIQIPQEIWITEKNMNSFGTETS